MSVESVYRGAMRVYPAQWRRDNEDEAVGVLLDVAEASGAARADPRQTASLVLNGLRARLELVLPARWRALAAASVMVGTTGFALVDLIFFEWQPWARTPVYPHAGILWPLAPFSTPQAAVVIGWLLAVMMWATGARAVARVLFAVTGVLSILLVRFAMHPVYIIAEAPHFVVTPRLVLQSFLAPESDPSVGSTLAVFVVGSIVVLCGDADRALRPSRQLLGAVGAGFTILLLWRIQGTYQTVLFNAVRRSDDDLWRGWTGLWDRTTLVDVWAIIFLVVVALTIGLGLRRAAARLVAMLGPMAVVWAVYYLLFHDGLRFADGWALLGHLSFVIGAPWLAWAAARRIRPILVRASTRVVADELGAPRR